VWLSDLFSSPLNLQGAINAAKNNNDVFLGAEHNWLEHQTMEDRYQQWCTDLDNIRIAYTASADEDKQAFIINNLDNKIILLKLKYHFALHTNWMATQLKDPTDSIDGFTGTNDRLMKSLYQILEFTYDDIENMFLKNRDAYKNLYDFYDFYDYEKILNKVKVVEQSNVNLIINIVDSIKDSSLRTIEKIELGKHIQDNVNSSQDIENNFLKIIDQVNDDYHRSHNLPINIFSNIISILFEYKNKSLQNKLLKQLIKMFFRMEN